MGCQVGETQNCLQKCFSKDRVQIHSSLSHDHFSWSLCVRDVSRNQDYSIPCAIATPWSQVTRSVLAMMVPCSTPYMKEQVTPTARAAGTCHEFQLYYFIINRPKVAIYGSLGSYLLKDEKRTHEYRIKRARASLSTREGWGKLWMKSPSHGIRKPSTSRRGGSGGTWHSSFTS